MHVSISVLVSTYVPCSVVAISKELCTRQGKEKTAGSLKLELSSVAGSVPPSFRVAFFL